MVENPLKTPRKRSRHRLRKTNTREKLIAAARGVFSEKGLDLTRIDEITERADVGKGTFYYHFRTKENIIREVIREVMAELVDMIDERCAETTDLRELLDKLIGAHISFFCNRWEDFVLYFQGRTDLTLREGYAGIEPPFVEYLQHVEGLLASVINYRLPGPVLRRLACAVAGFVSGYYSFAVVTSQEEDVDETFSSLRGAMVASLARFVQEAAPRPENVEPRPQEEKEK